MQVKVFGEASSKTFSVKNISSEDESLSVLNFLLKHKFAIAYSCSGKKVCKKCIVGHSILSCSTILKDYINEFGDTISVGYL